MIQMEGFVEGKYIGVTCYRSRYLSSTVARKNSTITDLSCQYDGRCMVDRGIMELHIVYVMDCQPRAASLYFGTKLFTRLDRALNQVVSLRADGPEPVA